MSYTLTSKRGNRAQLSSMISTCHAAGVKVITGQYNHMPKSTNSWSTTLQLSCLLDTLFNHMAGSDSGTGTAGSTFTHYVYPGIYQNQDFHHCGLETGDDIVNYDNRVEVQTCELVNLAEWVIFPARYFPGLNNYHKSCHRYRICQGTSGTICEWLVVSWGWRLPSRCSETWAIDLSLDLGCY